MQKVVFENKGGTPSNFPVVVQSPTNSTRLPLSKPAPKCGRTDDFRRGPTDKLHAPMDWLLISSMFQCSWEFQVNLHFNGAVERLDWNEGQTLRTCGTQRWIGEKGWVGYVCRFKFNAWMLSWTSTLTLRTNDWLIMDIEYYIFR